MLASLLSTFFEALLCPIHGALWALLPTLYALGPRALKGIKHYAKSKYR